MKPSLTYKLLVYQQFYEMYLFLGPKLYFVPTEKKKDVLLFFSVSVRIQNRVRILVLRKQKPNTLSTEAFSQYNESKKYFSLLFSVKIYTIFTIPNR